MVIVSVIIVMLAVVALTTLTGGTGSLQAMVDHLSGEDKCKEIADHDLVTEL